MDIEISPAGVIRAADAVATAAEQLAAGDVAGAPGNDGFQFSAAITRFASEMQQSTAYGPMLDELQQRLDDEFGPLAWAPRSDPKPAPVTTAAAPCASVRSMLSASRPPSWIRRRSRPLSTTYSPSSAFPRGRR